MAFDFDRRVDRRNTRSYKWDQSMKLFGRDDVLPLWVADMDFESPPAVKEALLRRAEIGLYGYTIPDEGYRASIIRWFARRHNWRIEAEWLSDSPGVVTSLSIAVDLFSEPGSPVILQSPVYYPFYDVIRMNGRQVAASPLVKRNGRYEMDFGHLESLMKNGARLLLLCNPHNPGGRAWSREELLQLAELCQRYGVTVVSDEIHCDLTLPGHRHIPFASVSEAAADMTLTCLAATKTFNLPGLQTSFIVASNRDIKRAFDRRLKTLSLHMANFFAHDAVKAAYDTGDAWLDDLLAYLAGNLSAALDVLAERLPEAEPMVPEATYLLWSDFSRLGLDAAGLKRLMYEKAGVVFNEGSIYGREGEGHLRINLACPRSLLLEALDRFCTAARDARPS